jgi:hypothetical protein
MSTISADDLQNTSGGIPTVKGQRLIPTAWVSFDGTGTVSIKSSENVSSITDVGTADYRINFATAMANANYSAATTCYYTGSGTGLNAATRDYLTTYLGIYVVADHSVSVIDNPRVSVQIMGGQ